MQRLFVGTSLQNQTPYTTLESIIPNSQIVVNPPSAILSADGTVENSPLVKERSTEWHAELFLKPGDWVPWVAAAVIGMVFVLGMVVVGLNEKEKVSFAVVP